MLTEQDFKEAAKVIGCEVAAIKAVAQVESRGVGFLKDGSIKILYEPHVFSRLTKRKYDAQYPKLSYEKWKTLPYGTETEQWAKLNDACKLDRNAALQSASYGSFQIMGFNYKVCGYKDIESFVEAMKDEKNQLLAFCNFVKGNSLDDEIRDKNWAKFTAGYNGTGQVELYSARMAEAYNKFK